MKITTEDIEYGKHVSKVLSSSRNGLPKVRTNINQSDCPHWALDLIEELGGDSTNVNRKNLFLSLSTSLANNDFINEKYPQLSEIVQIAVIKEITYKPKISKATKQKTDSKRKMVLMIKLLNSILRELNGSVKHSDRFTFIPQYIAEAKQLKGAKAIKPESFYRALASLWDLDQGSHADADSYMSIKSFLAQNRTAKSLYKSFTPIKVPI